MEDSRERATLLDDRASLTDRTQDRSPHPVPREPCITRTRRRVHGERTLQLLELALAATDPETTQKIFLSQ